MCSSDIIDPQFVVGVQNCKKFVLIYKFGSDIVNWDFEVKLIMLDVFTSPGYDRLVSIDYHGDYSFAEQQRLIFEMTLNSPCIKIMLFAYKNLLELAFIILNLIRKVNSSIGKSI